MKEQSLGLNYGGGGAIVFPDFRYFLMFHISVVLYSYPDSNLLSFIYFFRMVKVLWSHWTGLRSWWTTWQDQELLFQDFHHLFENKNNVYQLVQCVKFRNKKTQSPLIGRSRKTKQKKYKENEILKLFFYKLSIYCKLFIFWMLWFRQGCVQSFCSGVDTNLQKPLSCKKKCFSNILKPNTRLILKMPYPL